MAEANYAEAVAQQDVISELLGKCFAARTVCEQKYIFEIPFLRSFIPEGRTSFLILASPLAGCNHLFNCLLNHVFYIVSPLYCCIAFML